MMKEAFQEYLIFFKYTNILISKRKMKLNSNSNLKKYKEIKDQLVSRLAKVWNLLKSNHLQN